MLYLCTRHKARTVTRTQNRAYKSNNQCHDHNNCHTPTSQHITWQCHCDKKNRRSLKFRNRVCDWQHLHTQYSVHDSEFWELNLQQFPCFQTRCQKSSIHDDSRILQCFTSPDITVPSVFWHRWLGGMKNIWAVKNWVMRCRHGYLSVRCKSFAYVPADATATPSVKSEMVSPSGTSLPRLLWKHR